MKPTQSKREGLEGPWRKETPVKVDTHPEAQKWGTREGLRAKPIPEGLWEGLHAVLEREGASSQEAQLVHDAGSIDHMAPCLRHQGQLAQGHLDHPQHIDL